MFYSSFFCKLFIHLFTRFVVQSFDESKNIYKKFTHIFESCQNCSTHWTAFTYYFHGVHRFLHYFNTQWCVYINLKFKCKKSKKWHKLCLNSRFTRFVFLSSERDVTMAERVFFGSNKTATIAIFAAKMVFVCCFENADFNQNQLKNWRKNENFTSLKVICGISLLSPTVNPFCESNYWNLIQGWDSKKVGWWWM